MVCCCCFLLVSCGFLQTGQVSLPPNLESPQPPTDLDLFPLDSLKNFCKIKDEDLKTEIARFENMILNEGARLKKEGKQGLEILPGVKTLLGSVRRIEIFLFKALVQADISSEPVDSSGKLDDCYLW
jgi:hypothetical protein